MDKEDKTVMVLINQLTRALPGYLPLDDDQKSSEAPKRFALAAAYANKGFRDYLISAIRNQTAALADAEDIKGIWFQKGRIEVLRELLRVSKQMFEESERLSNSLKNSQ